MKEEENVYEETTRAEETTTDSEKENASTVPSKFKDVDALVRAYGSLQAEFTRRSQRLKELEKMAENFEKGEPRAAYSGAEKLRKNAKARKVETKQFDEFVKNTMEVNARETEENEPISEPKSLHDYPSNETPFYADVEVNGYTMYEANAGMVGSLSEKGDVVDPRKEPLKSGAQKGEQPGVYVAESGNAADPSESLYRQASRDEKVRLKIIGEYLSSLGRSGAPLMAGGAGMLAAPPIKPKSISDAGNMALLYFKKPRA